MRVVIVGKTKMKGGVCVGGVVQATGKAVRLIPKGAACNPIDTEFEVGELWELDIKARLRTTPPHVEDHDILRPGSFIKEIRDLNAWLRKHVECWEGDRTIPFNGTLHFRDNGTAYVPQDGELPECSTGFWLLPNKMIYSPFEKDGGEISPYYRLAGVSPLKVPYVGLLPPKALPDVLPPGTLVRLSLAHPWPTAPQEENRNKCFLQLSGWYS